MSQSAADPRHASNSFFAASLAEADTEVAAAIRIKDGKAEFDLGDAALAGGRLQGDLKVREAAGLPDAPWPDEIAVIFCVANERVSRGCVKLVMISPTPKMPIASSTTVNSKLCPA